MAAAGWPVGMMRGVRVLDPLRTVREGGMRMGSSTTTTATTRPVAMQRAARALVGVMWAVHTQAGAATKLAAVAALPAGHL